MLVYIYIDKKQLANIFEVLSLAAGAVQIEATRILRNIKKTQQKK